MTKNCPPDDTNADQKQDTSQAQNLNVTCYKCNGKGHYANACSERGKNLNLIHMQFNSGNRSKITAHIDGIRSHCQIDGGADRLIMREDFYKRISQNYELDNERVTLNGAAGPIVSMGNACVPTSINGTVYKLKYTVVPEKNMPSKILLGDPILDVVKILLSKEGPIIIGNDFVQLIQEEITEKNDGITIAINRVPEAMREQVKHLLENYSPKTPSSTPIKMHIKLKDTRPIACRPRRLSPADEIEVEKQVQDWLDKGVIV